MSGWGHAHWQAIEATGPDDCKFLRKAWFDSWRMYFSDDRQRHGAMAYGYIGDHESGYAVLPHSFQKRGPFKFAMLAGEFFPRRGIAHSSISDKLIDKTVDYLTGIEGVSGFRFGPVNKNDPFIAKVVEALDQKGWRIMNSVIGHDFGMDVPDDFDDYFADFSKSRRKKTAYYRRRLEAAGSVTFKHHNDLNAEDWEKVFSALEIVESKSWVAKQGDPHFIGPDHQFFWTGLITDEWFKKAVNVWMLYLDGEPVSYLVGLDTGAERYILASSYDEAVAQYRTGHHLELEMLKSTIEEGKVSYINNGLGNSGYKDAWGSKEYIELADIVAFPPTLKGKVAYFAARLMSRFSK